VVVFSNWCSPFVLARANPTNQTESKQLPLLSQ
jgi:hypothetical protein